MLARVLHRRFGEGPTDALAPMRTRHDEARDDPDARIVEVGIGRAAGDDGAAAEPDEVRARLDGAPAHRGVAVVGEQPRAIDAGGHLRLEAIVQPLVADRPPVAAGDLVPLAPAVRRVALRAEHRFDVAERRVAGVNDAEAGLRGESSGGGAFIPSR